MAPAQRAARPSAAYRRPFESEASAPGDRHHRRPGPGKRRPAATAARSPEQRAAPARATPGRAGRSAADTGGGPAMCHRRDPASPASRLAYPVSGRQRSVGRAPRSPGQLERSARANPGRAGRSAADTVGAPARGRHHDPASPASLLEFPASAVQPAAGDRSNGPCPANCRDRRPCPASRDPARSPICRHLAARRDNRHAATGRTSRRARAASGLQHRASRANRDDANVRVPRDSGSSPADCARYRA